MPARAVAAVERLEPRRFFSAGSSVDALAAPAHADAYVRVNGVGYVAGEPKRAVVLADQSEAGAWFAVLDVATGAAVLSGPLSDSLGAWSDTFGFTYAIDFGAVAAPGRYQIAVTGPAAATSPVFPIAAAAGDLYAPLLANAVSFYQVQRDGPDVVPGTPLPRTAAHVADASAGVYDIPKFSSGNNTLVGKLRHIGGPIDVAGGWADAGDYLKFVETTSYTDAALLLAARQYAGASSGVPSATSASLTAEARFGLDWLLKMWDPQAKTLYLQVGLGDGNAKVAGDHDEWRIPEADDAREVAPGDYDYFLKYRPLFRAAAPGKRISPNLAGRLAAAFALGYQVFLADDPAYAARCLAAGQAIFDQAKTTNVGRLRTAAPFGYYPETEWRDDMEWGAAELYLATAQAARAGAVPAGVPHADAAPYLASAARWAKAYINGPNHGADTLNLYDDSALAHFDLYRALEMAGRPTDLKVTQATLLDDLRGQLDAAAQNASADPFGLGFNYNDGDVTPHAIGVAVTANLYAQLAGDATTYAALARTQRDWVLGANAWGSSFVVGAGGTFPTQLQHQTANLAGSLDGGPPALLGAVVDGPNGAAEVASALADGYQDGMRVGPPPPADYDAFTARGVRYADDVRVYSCVEPADDYTALTPLLFAEQL